jgi:hypothetical protein
MMVIFSGALFSGADTRGMAKLELLSGLCTTLDDIAWERQNTKFVDIFNAMLLDEMLLHYRTWMLDVLHDIHVGFGAVLPFMFFSQTRQSKA